MDTGPKGLGFARPCLFGAAGAVRPGAPGAAAVAPAIVTGTAMPPNDLPIFQLIVSDDGSRDDDRFARFLILQPEQLRIAD